MIVPYARRSLASELVDRVFQTVVEFLDEVGDDEEAGAVVAVVTVDGYDWWRIGLGGWGGGALSLFGCFTVVVSLGGLTRSLDFGSEALD